MPEPISWGLFEWMATGAVVLIVSLVSLLGSRLESRVQRGEAAHQDNSVRLTQISETVVAQGKDIEALRRDVESARHEDRMLLEMLDRNHRAVLDKLNEVETESTRQHQELAKDMRSRLDTALSKGSEDRRRVYERFDALRDNIDTLRGQIIGSSSLKAD